MKTKPNKPALKAKRKPHPGDNTWYKRKKSDTFDMQRVLKFNKESKSHLE